MRTDSAVRFCQFLVLSFALVLAACDKTGAGQKGALTQMADGKPPSSSVTPRATTEELAHPKPPTLSVTPEASTEEMPGQTPPAVRITPGATAEPGVASGSGSPCTTSVSPGSSIQEAIDQAEPDSTICLPNGTWKENITISKSLTLRGASEETRPTQIIGLEQGHPVIRVEGVQGTEVTIEALTVAEAKGVECAEPMWVCPLGITVLDDAKVRIRAVEISKNPRAGLGVYGSAQVTLVDSTVGGNQGDGLQIANSSQVAARNNRLLNNGKCGVRAVSGTEAPEIQGSGNEMWGNGVDLCGKIPGDLRKPLVSGMGETELSVPADYASMQEAVDAVAPGGTITVGEGTFTEGFTLWKPVIIRGSGQETTFLHNQAEASSESGAPVVSIIAEARGVTIRDLSISDGPGAGILVYGEADLQAVKITSNRGVGIEVIGSGELDLSDVQVSGNGSNGFSVGERASVSLRDGSRVSSNGQIDSGGDGFEIYGDATVELTDSEIIDNRSDGLAVAGQARVTLQDVFLSNADDGIFVGGEAEMSLTNVTISNHGDDGLIVFGSATVDLADCSVANNGQMGLLIFIDSTVTLDNVDIVGNGIHGLYVGLRDGKSAGSPTVGLTECQISGSGQNGLMIGGEAQVEVRSALIEGNGLSEDCQQTDGLCNGIEVLDQAEVTLDNCTVSHNTDWGVASWLRQCGYAEDRFSGQVEMRDTNAVEGNNVSGNQAGLGNSGPQVFLELPHGQICLGE